MSVVYPFHVRSVAPRMSSVPGMFPARRFPNEVQPSTLHVGNGHYENILIRKFLQRNELKIPEFLNGQLGKEN